jgi:hypothetical protein
MITVLLLALAFAIMLLWTMYLFQKRESMIAYPPTSCVSVHGRLVCS